MVVRLTSVLGARTREKGRGAGVTSRQAATEETPAPYRRRKTIMGYCQIRTANCGNIFSVTRAIE